MGSDDTHESGLTHLSARGEAHMVDVGDLGREAGMASAAAGENAQTLVGYYRAAQTFAFVPYQLILSMTFIVFPMVSRALASGDEDAARRTIQGALRFSMLALLAIACPIAGASDGVMRIAYPEAYLAGAPALGALVFGIAAFALFVITATVLTSAGQPRVAALIAGVSLGVVLVATRFFIVAAGPDNDALLAAALGTCAGTVFALLGAGAAVYARFRAFLPPLSSPSVSSARSPSSRHRAGPRPDRHGRVPAPPRRS